MSSYSSPAFSRTASAAPDSNEACACGTSMLTKAILSVPSLSAAAIGTPNSVASGLTIVKLVSVSASRPSVLVWKNSVGTPAACSGSHTESATRGLAERDGDDARPRPSGWRSRWPPAGSAPVSQVTTSIGRPPTPARWVFQYSAAASAARSSSVLSNACVAPSDTMPTLDRARPTPRPRARAGRWPRRRVVASSSSADASSSSSPRRRRRRAAARSARRWRASAAATARVVPSPAYPCLSPGSWTVVLLSLLSLSVIVAAATVTAPARRARPRSTCRRRRTWRRPRCRRRAGAARG